MLTDLIQRSDDLRAFYSDAGILSRDSIYSIFHYGNMWYSPYFMSGSAYFQGFLFAIQATLCIALLFGFYTRIVAIFCWVFLISLHDRNTMILYGGDGIVRVLLFWSLFLPLEACWSFDKILNSSKRPIQKRLFSIATTALLLQVSLIYWIGIGFKWNASWLQGEAVEYALDLKQFITPWGIWLGQQHFLLAPLTYLTFYIELFGPLLAYSPFYTGTMRTLTVFLFSILHILFGVFLELGLFPYICITAWIPFLPSSFWDTIQNHVPSLNSFESYNRFCSYLRSHFKQRPLITRTSIVENAFTGFFLIYIALVGIKTLHPQWKPPLIGKYHWTNLSSLLHTDQFWTMFSTPLYDDGWYVVEGKLANGKRIDLFQDNKPLSWKEPKLISQTYKNDRWRKFMMNIWWKDNFILRPHYARYLCRTWNETHDGLQSLNSVRIYFMLTKIDLKHPEKMKEPAKPTMLWEHRCHR